MQRKCKIVLNEVETCLQQGEEYIVKFGFCGLFKTGIF
mgnify:CR=1 FL=1